MRSIFPAMILSSLFFATGTLRNLRIPRFKVVQPQKPDKDRPFAARLEL